MATINIFCDSFQDIEGDIEQGVEEAMYKMSVSDDSPAVADKPKNVISLSKDVVAVKTEDLEQKITNNITAIVALINEKPITDKGFYLSELEFTIGLEGTTKAVIPFLSAGLTAKSAITVRIKKKEA